MNDFEIIEGTGWFITPEGELLNFDNVERIMVLGDKIYVYTTGHSFVYDLNAAWKNSLRTLPEKLHANVID